MFNASEDENSRKEEEFRNLRYMMVANQIEIREIHNQGVLEALRKIKRHLFVPQEYIHFAYNDSPLPIGKNQTISQPYIVALMTELAEIKPSDKILEIGTGSGYQTAVLAELARKVYSVEAIPDLAKNAKTRLLDLGYNNIEFLEGDGYAGYKDEAPYDAIIVTAAADELPEKLILQLKTGGRMVIPIGEYFQELYVVTKNKNGQIEQRTTIPVRFVPLVHPPLKA